VIFVLSARDFVKLEIFPGVFTQRTFNVNLFLIRRRSINGRRVFERRTSRVVNAFVNNLVGGDRFLNNYPNDVFRLESAERVAYIPAIKRRSFYFPINGENVRNIALEIQ